MKSTKFAFLNHTYTKDSSLCDGIDVHLIPVV
jgi:hypothetical protein